MAWFFFGQLECEGVNRIVIGIGNGKDNRALQNESSYLEVGI